MTTKRKRVRDMSPIEQLRHYEDRQLFKALDKAAGIGDPMEITIQPCVFGYALIGTIWKDRLIAVELGSSIEEAVGNYVNHWNKTSLSRALFVGKDSPDPKVVDNVLRVINNGGLVDHTVHKNLSMDGTMFQRKVWMDLLKIPAGTTETYQQIAERIGEPKSVRAIGNAVGANPIAIIIPCHRVVRSDGKIGGYRWGEGVKRKLLDREGAI